MGYVMADDEDGDGAAVVVVETPPAGPDYVTRGELDARLALQERDLDERIRNVAHTAWAARDSAEDAAEDAAVAAVVAAAAAETAAEVAESVEDAGTSADADDDEQGGVKPPQPRSKPADGDTAEKERPVAGKSAGGYGAGFLSRR